MTGVTQKITDAKRAKWREKSEYSFDEVRLMTQELYRHCGRAMTLLAVREFIGPGDPVRVQSIALRDYERFMRRIKGLLDYPRGQLLVKAVAVKKDGVIHTLPRPARHDDVIRGMHEGSGEPVTGEEQGFILEDGTFVNRYVAAEVALREGQIAGLQFQKDQLFSEDVW